MKPCFENVNDISDAKLFNENMIKQVVNQIEYEAQYLINTLNKELEHIQKCKELKQDYQPNSFGIVQKQGISIDINCSRLLSLYETRTLLDSLK